MKFTELMDEKPDGGQLTRPLKFSFDKWQKILGDIQARLCRHHWITSEKRFAAMQAQTGTNNT